MYYICNDVTFFNFRKIQINQTRDRNSILQSINGMDKYEGYYQGAGLSLS